MCVRIICIIAENEYFAFNVLFNWKLHQENMNEGNIFLSFCSVWNIAKINSEIKSFLCWTIGKYIDED